MRIKGFFWFLTILLTVVCLYQLSFTWVANNVEADAEKQAISIVSKKKKEAMANIEISTNHQDEEKQKHSPA